MIYHPRVSEDEAGILQQVHLVADLHAVRRGIVLHFLARLEMVPTRRVLGFEADAMAPAVARERLVGQDRAPLLQFLVDPHQVLFAGDEQFQDVVVPGFRLLLPNEWGHVLAP